MRTDGTKVPAGKNDMGGDAKNICTRWRRNWWQS